MGAHHQSQGWFAVKERSGIHILHAVGDGRDVAQEE